jgi:hypothetical protein
MPHLTPNSYFSFLLACWLPYTLLDSSFLHSKLHLAANVTMICHFNDANFTIACQQHRYPECYDHLTKIDMFYGGPRHPWSRGEMNTLRCDLSTSSFCSLGWQVNHCMWHRQTQIFSSSDGRLGDTDFPCSRISRRVVFPGLQEFFVPIHENDQAIIVTMKQLSVEF